MAVFLLRKCSTHFTAHYFAQLVYMHLLLVVDEEKKLNGIEWNAVTDKAERVTGLRLRISHTKVP